MTAPKPDRLTKQRLRGALNDLQRADMRALSGRLQADLAPLARERLHRELGQDAYQADMQVLARYRVAAPVHRVTLRGWNPDTRRYDQTFSVEVDADLLAPETVTGQTSRTIFLDAADPDLPRLTNALARLDAMRAAHRAETQALEDAFRRTTSARKLRDMLDRGSEIVGKILPTSA